MSKRTHAEEMDGILPPPQKNLLTCICNENNKPNKKIEQKSNHVDKIQTKTKNEENFRQFYQTLYVISRTIEEQKCFPQKNPIPTPK